MENVKEKKNEEQGREREKKKRDGDFRAGPRATTLEKGGERRVKFQFLEREELLQNLEY